MNTTPHLDDIRAFEQALAHYTMSPQAQQVLQQTQLLLMVGISSAGRNTIIKQLLKRKKYHFIVSDTTRPPRTNNGILEQNGVEYFFRKESDMLADIRQGLFVEAAVIHGQQVSGVSVREIQRAKDADEIAVVDIEIVGAVNVLNASPDALALFVLPPSFDEWLTRLKGRGAMSRDELHRRLQSAVNEITMALEDNRFIFMVNDSLDEAVDYVDALATSKLHDAQHEAEARHLAEVLRDDIVEYLQTL